jgi:hypothetical protein
MCAAWLESQQPSSPELAQVRAGIDRLVELNRELAELNLLVPEELAPTSFDAPKALRPHR